jgi:MraZ protein
LIPEQLKAYAALRDKVVVAGVAERVELWDEAAWRTYTEAIERDANAFAETVG